MNRLADDVSKALALLVAAVLLLLGTAQGLRPGVLAVRVIVAFVGVWGTGYLAAHAIGRALITAALHRAQEAETSSVAAAEEAEAIRRTRNRAA